VSHISICVTRSIGGNKKFLLVLPGTWAAPATKGMQKYRKLSWKSTSCIRRFQTFKNWRKTANGREQTRML